MYIHSLTLPQHLWSCIVKLATKYFILLSELHIVCTAIKFIRLIQIYAESAMQKQLISS